MLYMFTIVSGLLVFFSLYATIIEASQLVELIDGIQPR